MKETYNYFDFSPLISDINTWIISVFGDFWANIIGLVLIGVAILLFYAVVGLYLVYVTYVHYYSLS